MVERCSTKIRIYSVHSVSRIGIWNVSKDFSDNENQALRTFATVNVADVCHTYTLFGDFNAFPNSAKNSRARGRFDFAQSASI